MITSNHSFIPVSISAFPLGTLIISLGPRFVSGRRLALCFVMWRVFWYVCVFVHEWECVSVVELWVCQGQDGGVTLHMVDPQLTASLGQFSGKGVVRQEVTLMCCLLCQLVFFVFFLFVPPILLICPSLSVFQVELFFHFFFFQYPPSPPIAHALKLSLNQSFHFPLSSLWGKGVKRRRGRH